RDWSSDVCSSDLDVLPMAYTDAGRNNVVLSPDNRRRQHYATHEEENLNCSLEGDRGALQPKVQKFHNRESKALPSISLERRARSIRILYVTQRVTSTFDGRMPCYCADFAYFPTIASSFFAVS